MDGNSAHDRAEGEETELCEELDFKTGSRSGPRSLDGTLLFLFGFGMAAAGLAMAAAPNLSWSLAKIAAKLASMGLGAGTFFVGGITLVGLGLVARSVASAAHQASDDGGELSLMLEQLASEQASIHAAQSRLDQRVAALAKASESRSLQIAQALQQSSSSSESDSGDGETTNAVWRLAASLDQLAARIDRGLEDHGDRMAELASETERMVGEKVASLASDLTELSSRMNERPARESAAPATPAVHPEPRPEPVQAPVAAAPAPAQSVAEPVSAQPEVVESPSMPAPAPAVEPAMEPPTPAVAASEDVFEAIEGIDFLSHPADGDAEPKPQAPAQAIAFDEPAAPLPSAPEAAAPVDAPPTGEPAATPRRADAQPPAGLDGLLPD